MVEVYYIIYFALYLCIFVFKTVAYYGFFFLFYFPFKYIYFYLFTFTAPIFLICWYCFNGVLCFVLFLLDSVYSSVVGFFLHFFGDYGTAMHSGGIWTNETSAIVRVVKWSPLFDYSVPNFYNSFGVGYNLYKSVTGDLIWFIELFVVKLAIYYFSVLIFTIISYFTFLIFSLFVFCLYLVPFLYVVVGQPFLISLVVFLPLFITVLFLVPVIYFVIQFSRIRGNKSFEPFYNFLNGISEFTINCCTLYFGYRWSRFIGIWFVVPSKVLLGVGSSFMGRLWFRDIIDRSLLMSFRTTHAHHNSTPLEFFDFRFIHNETYSISDDRSFTKYRKFFADWVSANKSKWWENRRIDNDDFLYFYKARIIFVQGCGVCEVSCTNYGWSYVRYPKES